MLLTHLFENKAQISEGGNVFDNTVAINREFVPGIVKQIKKLLSGTNVYPDIGSAGYKVQSGDMDVMIDAKELADKFGVSDVKEAKKALQELLGKQNLETKLSGQNVHVKMPLPDGQFAQVDLMIIPDAKMVAPYHQHGPRGSYEDPGFKGSEIFIMIASIAKSMGLKFEPFGAKLVRRDTGDLVARSRDDVARILLNPNASGDDLNSVKSIMNALKDDPKREEKLAQARIDSEKGLIRLPESDVQEASSLDTDVDYEAGPDVEYDKKELKAKVNQMMLSALTPKEERIVRMYLYHDMTFAEIGDKLGHSKQWVYQIFQKALRKLRHPTNYKPVRDFDPDPERNADRELDRLNSTLMKRYFPESSDQVKGTEKARTVKPRPFAGSQPHPFQGKLVGGEAVENPTDRITMDIPLFIRMMEYAREDAKDDMDLHDVAEKAIQLMQDHDYLCMDNYDELVSSDENLEEGLISRLAGLVGAYYGAKHGVPDWAINFEVPYGTYEITRTVLGGVAGYAAGATAGDAAASSAKALVKKAAQAAFNRALMAIRGGEDPNRAWKKFENEVIAANKKSGNTGRKEPTLSVPPAVKTEGKKPKPTKPELWSRAKAAARSKFEVYPSAYANAWAAKWYKSKGGGWRS